MKKVHNNAHGNIIKNDVCSPLKKLCFLIVFQTVNYFHPINSGRCQCLWTKRLFELESTFCQQNLQLRKM